MSALAVSMVRNEADVIEPVVRQMATQVDRLVVADHRSTDGTREILEELAADLDLQVVDDPQVGHGQGETLTALARQGAREGFDWIVPFDGDEWFYSPHGRIADVLAECPQSLVFAPSYTHLATGVDDPGVGDPVKRLGWREPNPVPLPKVACRAAKDLKIGQGNHVAVYDDDVETVRGKFAIRHFQYRSAEHFERKIRERVSVMAKTDHRGRFSGHWLRHGDVLERAGPGALEAVYREQHYREDPRAEAMVEGELRPPLVFDPVCGAQGGGVAGG